ncbi:MAG: ADP-heptose:LPS heptosyltransferase [Candidatus Marinamargulisbacteria bacterium]|jgi:ADP-heptose:LPS heptosyltransferase
MKTLPVEKFQKILIVRPDAIGDMVLTLPCVKAIKEAHPHLHISILASSYNAKVVEHLPYIDEIIVDRYTTGEAETWRQRWAYSRFLKDKNFDVAVHFYSESKQVWTAVAAGIPIHLGDKAKIGLWPVFRKHGVFLKSFDQTKHVIDYNFQLLQPLGVRKPESLSKVLPPPEEGVSRAKGLLKEAGYEGNHPLVGIHPGVGAGNRPITPEKYVAFIKKLREKVDVDICITGYSESEKSYRDRIVKGLAGDAIDMVGKTSVSELMGVLSQYSLYVGVDTGPSHLASALGVPQIAIFPSKKVKPTRWAPWRNSHFVVRESHVCPHFCPHEGCPLTICSDELQVSDMVEKAIDLLQGGGIKTGVKQFRYWFCQSMVVLILFDDRTTQAATAFSQSLTDAGIRNYRSHINDKTLSEKLMVHNVSIMHNLTKRRKWRLFWVSQRASRKLFNPPLVIHGDVVIPENGDVIDFYTQKFEAKWL